jgi:hypothetical protein
VRPKEFYLNIVLPNCEDFWGDKTNVRKAYNAATSVFNLHEWILHDKTEVAAIKSHYGVDLSVGMRGKDAKEDERKRLADFRALIGKETDGAFFVLHDIVIGYKHFVVSRAKQVDDPLRKIEIGTFEWEDVHFWTDAEIGEDEQIIIMVTSTEKRGFAATLGRVATFFEHHFS